MNLRIISRRWRPFAFSTSVSVLYKYIDITAYNLLFFLCDTFSSSHFLLHRTIEAKFFLFSSQRTWKNKRILFSFLVFRSLRSALFLSFLMYKSRMSEMLSRPNIQTSTCVQFFRYTTRSTHSRLTYSAPIEPVL